MQNKQVYILISGRVQGVGFRYFAHSKATELDICGWVKNTPDRKVEIEATGEIRKMEAFIGWMKIGPPRAVVSSFLVSDITPERKFSNFKVY